jgi:hypothetical protein
VSHPPTDPLCPFSDDYDEDVDTETLQKAVNAPADEPFLHPFDADPKGGE